MAEKRRLSARERREPAAKRRASEAVSRPSPQPQHSSRKKASTPVVAPSPPPPPPEPTEPPLPTKIKDVDGLPTTAAPQSTSLTAKEYQSFAESAVLLASLERSKKKWLSDGILERYWTKPKKTKREQIEGKNPPKETMSKVGACNIVVGPHLFDAMLYTVKDPNAPPPIQYTTPQRPMVHYGHPNNFQQYHPYPHSPAPPQNARQHPAQGSPATPGTPQPAYPSGSHPPPSHPARTPSQPPHRAPGPQSAQRPSPSQNPQTNQPPKPSPDPVIQMLATRAASDPDLKALMRVVASSKASQEQLRAFQAHIDELNAIIRAREQQQQRQQQQRQSQPSTPAHPPPSRQSQPPPQTPQPQQTPQQSQTPSSQKPPQQPDQQKPQGQPQSQSSPRVEVQVPKPSPSATSAQPSNTNSSQPPPTPTPQAPKPAPQVSIKQEPGVVASGQSTSQPTSSPNVTPAPAATPDPQKQSSPAVRPMPPPQQQQPGPRPGPPYPPYQQAPYQGHPPAIQSRPLQYGSPAPYYRPAPPPPPPRLNYKSVVFEFTSPLTPYGSSTSGHAGSGDRYLFPEYTILEWLPGGNTVLASFLLVKKVDPNTPFPLESASETTTTRAKGKASKSKSKKADKNKDQAGEADKEKETEKDKSKDKANDKPESSTDDPKPDGDKPAGTAQPEQKAESSATPNKSSTDKEDSKGKKGDAKDTSNLKEYYQPVTFRIFSNNPKVLEPLSRVVKPADEVRKYMNKIMDRAERAPDGFLAYRLPQEETDDNQGREAEDTKKSGTPVPGGRGRLQSRSKTMDEESDLENIEKLAVEEEEEEELKDYYGPPTGLPPMGA
ncbi:hypothetical protein BO78DRAFT_342988 [Aspergillus sclerotiicarbonarius CBS 121057]|uniref:SWR1-complex protein 3 domain-containing protein n=1 Tax=Aspergillus sclerotiicarbonarius (strain CBS 121057 / IBT 28362) TaxID=1448318 RepID=A0A319E8S7_ASPSB|nr:hypothetical protein BO78DRAFT_342988 [Aspergillus sclerotiicarbonarius CBS 121057]